MINENALWVRAIDPMSGRITKQETFLAALIKTIIMFAAVAVLASFIFSL